MNTTLWFVPTVTRDKTATKHIVMPSTENKMQKWSPDLSSFSTRIISSKIMKKNSRPTDRPNKCTKIYFVSIISLLSYFFFFCFLFRVISVSICFSLNFSSFLLLTVYLWPLLLSLYLVLTHFVYNIRPQYGAIWQMTHLVKYLFYFCASFFYNWPWWKRRRKRWMNRIVFFWFSFLCYYRCKWKSEEIWKYAIVADDNIWALIITGLWGRPT